MTHLRHAPSRRSVRLLLLAAGLVAAVALTATACGSPQTDVSASGTGTSELSPAAPTPSPGATDDTGRTQRPKRAATHTADPRNPTDYPDQLDVVPTQRQPKLRPVPLRRPASFGSGVTASVVATQPVRIKAKGPGEIEGAGVRFAIRLTNGTGGEITTDEVTVAVYVGQDRTPALPAGANQNNPFAGTVADRASQTGSYVFLVPPAERDDIRLEVSYTVTQPYVVFLGSVA